MGVEIRSVYLCCGWNFWCVLDAITRCKLPWVCNRHDLEITRDWIHCGDETCTEDHG